MFLQTSDQARHAESRSRQARGAAVRAHPRRRGCYGSREDWDRWPWRKSWCDTCVS